MVAKSTLTDLKVKSLPLPPKGQTCYWDTLPGFGIRISQGGSRTFLLKHKNRFITLGKYHPEIFPLAKARDEAKRILAEFTLGKVRPQSLAVSEAIKLFVEDKKRSRRQNTAEGYEWLLNRLRLQGQIAEVGHGDLTRGLARIKSKSTYDHALVAARIFFNWAQKRRYVSENPTFGLTPHGTPKRSRTLTPEELSAIWQACSDTENELPAHYRAIVKLLALTGQRRGEIAAIQISWIDLENKTIAFPETITKNKRQHTIPLAACAVSELKSAKQQMEKNTPTTAFLFPARGGSGTCFNGWSKSKAQLDALSGVTDWTLHDLRRTFATTLAQLGTPIHVVEKLLNHVSGSISGVAEIYNRHQYWDDQVRAIDAYDAHLKTVLDLK